MNLRLVAATLILSLAAAPLVAFVFFVAYPARRWRAGDRGASFTTALVLAWTSAMISLAVLFLVVLAATTVR